MTQAYYTARLFPVYAKEINDTRVLYDRRGIEEEDNNLGHETRSKDNVVKRFKEVSLRWNVDSSPIFWFEPIRDLEYFKTASWTSKLEEWKTIAQLKEVLLNEWDKISIDEIRTRISEIPDRSKKMVANGSGVIKALHW